MKKIAKKLPFWNGYVVRPVLTRLRSRVLTHGVAASPSGIALIPFSAAAFTHLPWSPPLRSSLLIAAWTALHLIFHICSLLIKAIKIEEKPKKEKEIEKSYHSQQATSLSFDTKTKFTPSWFRFLISSIIFKAHLCSAFIFVRAKVVTTK